MLNDPDLGLIKLVCVVFFFLPLKSLRIWVNEIFWKAKLSSLPPSLFLKHGGDASVYAELRRSERIPAAAFRGTSFVYSHCATFKLQM